MGRVEMMHPAGHCLRSSQRGFSGSASAQSLLLQEQGIPSYTASGVDSDVQQDAVLPGLVWGTENVFLNWN